MKTLTRLLLAALLLSIISCNNENKNSSGAQASSETYPRKETLYVGGLQWGPPASFNPLHTTPAWPMTGNVNLIYEALFGYNQLTGKLEGILAKEFVFSKKTLEIQLHPDAKWHDGSAVTADDVVYTFELHKNYYTHLHSHWNFLSDVKAQGPGTVVFTLRNDNYNPLMIRDIISTTAVLPKSVFSAWEDSLKKAAPGKVLEGIRTLKNDVNMMASGPYTLEKYSDQKIVIKRVDNYWGNVLYENKMPAPNYVIHSGYKSNDKFNLALKQGLLDISQTFYPQIWKSFKQGVQTWYSEAPYYIPALIPSLLVNHTKKPFNDPAFRQAIARAINYEQIKNLAMYGYTPDIKPGFVIPFGKESKYFSQEDAKAYTPLYNEKAARKALSDAGYSWNKEGLLLDPQGQKLPRVKATCPSGWSDWESTLKIVITSLRAIGMDAREHFVEYPIWDKELKNGLFDMTMRTPQPDAAPSLPWSRFNKVMSSTDYRPVGEIMYQNEGRYKNPSADSLLALIPKLDSEEEKTKAYYALNKLFMKDLPVIPLLYRPWHLYQFSNKNWTNFPTDANPYAPPQMGMIGAGIKTLWGIQSTSN